MRNSSNRCRKYIHLFVVLLATLVVSSCSMTADNTLGSDIMPDGQAMEMRHLKFQGNNIIRINPNTGTNTPIPTSGDVVETRLYRTDSLLASNTGFGYMGVRRSDTLGLRTAGFASTILFMNAIDEKNGFGYKPIFDTMKLVLTIKNYGGDTLVPIRYKVYELEKSLAGNVLKYDERRKRDSVAYINCDLGGVYDANKPIFEFTFPNSELGEGPASIIIPMESTEYSWDFVRRLMLIPDNYADAESDWDGYGRSGIELYKDDKQWSEKFFGLYITPDMDKTPSDKQGAMYALDLSASGIMLQGRSRNPQDPTMIKDTVGMYYYFADEDSPYNASVNKVEHKYDESLTGGASLLNNLVMDCTKSREERTKVSTCYVEGMGGPATEIYLTDVFLDELLKIGTENGAGTKVGVNQCMLSIYVAGADYDWNITQGNAGNKDFISMLDGSFTRLGTYLNYNTLAPVRDYDYANESSSDLTTIYNGYLDRSRGCYTMNITAYMQHLFNYARSVRQEDGSYLFNETDADYIGRAIYIGTEAASPYAFANSVLQGMPSDNNGGTVTAPIQIDLTYTLIK